MYDYAQGTCPKAEEFSNRTISLPLHMSITAEDVIYVCNCLKESINKSK